MQVNRKKIIKQQVVYIPTKDLVRAQAFYADVFGFDPSAYNTVEDPSGEQWCIFPMTKRNEAGDTIPTGFFFLGLGHSPHLIPSDQGTIPFLPCEDMEATLERVREHGGKVLQSTTMERVMTTEDQQKIEIYYAFFLDTEGNKIGLTHGKVITQHAPPHP